MIHILCDEVERGLRSEEVLAIIKDNSGRKHYLRVEKDFLKKHNGNQYLPVALVDMDPLTRMVLVELPQEAETGANRLWMKAEQVLESIEMRCSHDFV